MNIFFDLDGTLIDSKRRLYELFCFLNKSVSLSYQEYWHLKENKINHKEILINKFGYNEEEFRLFEIKWMKEIEKDKWLFLDKPFVGIKELLNSLSKNHNLYLVTARQSKYKVLKQLNSFEWNSYFCKILVTEQKYEKYQLIVDNVVVSSDDYFVGDTGKDIETGKKLGIRTIAVLSGFLNKKSLIGYKPDFIFENVNNLLNNGNTLFEF
jgi:phosphoglycolate phosphatase